MSSRESNHISFDLPKVSDKNFTPFGRFATEAPYRRPAGVQNQGSTAYVIDADQAQGDRAMTKRPFLFAAALMLALPGAALAQGWHGGPPGGWHGPDRGWHGDWHGGPRGGWGPRPYVYGPPVYVGPPRVVYAPPVVYAAPPVVYAPPFISLGIGIR
jgi:hypothetical protein